MVVLCNNSTGSVCACDSFNIGVVAAHFTENPASAPLSGFGLTDMPQFTSSSMVHLVSENESLHRGLELLGYIPGLGSQMRDKIRFFRELGVGPAACSAIFDDFQMTTGADCGVRVYQQYYRDDAVTTEPAFTGFEMALLYDAVKTACSTLSPLSVETTVITIAFICGVCPSTAPLW